jgi:hypothetical protein
MAPSNINAAPRVRRTDFLKTYIAQVLSTP